MKTLVLAEKPSVGRDLGKILGCSSGGKGYLEGRNYVVTWAMGHLVELADPSHYDMKYRQWLLSDLPIIPHNMKFKVIKKTSRQFNLVKSLMKRGDISSLVIATDAGREGELVARLIMKLASWKGPCKRLWISSQTAEAVREGFGALKNCKEYDNLYHAALCRGEADWIVGINVTRALSCKYDVRLSAGRVQTPVLNLIAKRDEKIKNFKPEEFWKIIADFDKFTADWAGNFLGRKGVSRFRSRQEAEAIIQKLNGNSAEVIENKKVVKSVSPPLAYDLTALQRNANARLGFSAKKTLSTLQKLYERHKIATYPRTDSRYITKDMVPTLKDRLYSLKNTSYWQYAGILLKNEINPGNRFVNDSKVTDHHAILPTGALIDLNRLEEDEKKLMKLVIERFLEVLSPVLKKESTVLTLKTGGELFSTKGEKVLQRGWSSISGGGFEDSATESDLPIHYTELPEEGRVLNVKKFSIKNGFTTPPARYNEGTLLAAMENPSRFIKDDKLKKSILKGGLGTPATRAEVIEKILANNYVERIGKELKATSRGLELLSLVPEELKYPTLTAEWEKRLSGISEKGDDPKPFLKEIRVKTQELVADIAASTKKYTPRENPVGLCPLCGGALYHAHNKRGRKTLVCHALSCGYEEVLDSISPGKRPGARERAITRKYMAQNKSISQTSTFADFIKESKGRKTAK